LDKNSSIVVLNGRVSNWSAELSAFELPVDVQLDDPSVVEFRASLTNLIANATVLLDDLSLPGEKTESSGDK
jgi:hypothetical protein